MNESDGIARAWLAEMESCVRAVDYERCRAIFAPHVVGFGTKASIASGLDDLEHDQWRHIWGAIRDFTFLVDELHCGGSDAAVWLACPWRSLGPDETGGWVERPGRITAILERSGDRWLAVHTHHSVNPGPSYSPSHS